jgi:hypothetical protein
MITIKVGLRIFKEKRIYSEAYPLSKEIMKKLLYLPLLLIAIISCGKSGVEPLTDPTDDEAIYNIIRYDSPSAFNLDQFDTSIPDTTLGLSALYRPLFFWRNIAHDSLDIDIKIFNPQPTDSIGSVPYANVTVVKFFWGTLEVIALDTTGGGSQRVRLSKHFDMKGTITALFEKLGFDYNSRRGWRLMQLSDIVFTPQTQGQVLPLPRVDIQSVDSLIHVNFARKLLKYIPQFSQGDSITVIIHSSDSTNIIRMSYPVPGGHMARQIPHLSGGDFIGGFVFPGYEPYGHFLVESITASAINDTLPYRPNAVAITYRIRI